MNGKYVIQHAASSQFHWVLKAGNGESVLSSQLYNSKQSAETGIQSCRTNSSNDERFMRLVAKDGKPYFVLKAGNGQTIGQSQMYATVDGCKLGMDSVRRHAPDAALVDETQE